MGNMIKIKKLKTEPIIARKIVQSNSLVSTTHHPTNPTTLSSDAAMPVKIEQQPDLFRLDIDCIEKVFDYLSLKELINCAQTCKLMQAVAGYIFQLHYPFAYAIVDDDHIYVDMNGTRYNIDIFTEYVKCVMFTNVMCDRSQIQWHQFKSLTNVNFYYSQFNAQQIPLMENILHQAESIMLLNCQIDDELFQEFMVMCHRVKSISMGMAYNCGTNWLHGTYPTLQYLGIWPLLRNCGELQEFQQFIHQNPNISTFVFSSKFLFDNKQAIMTTKFEDLHIILDDEHFQAFLILMRELYEKEVYQRFHMKFFEYLDVKQQQIDQLPGINGLIGFRAPFNAHDINLNSLVNLEILQFTCSLNKIKNVHQLAQNLPHLTEIYFHEANIDDILPFLMQSTKLTKILVGKITNSTNQWIDLHAVNEKRRKLLGITNSVSKVIIYMVEDIYLRTRLKSITMSLRFVEMQRFERGYKLKF